jgi:hypothetical protein
VLTLERGTELLSAADSFDRLSAIAATIGFDEPPAELDAETKTLLGLPSEIGRAAVTGSHDTLRALLLECDCPDDFRSTLGAVANLLWKRSPQLLWMVLAVNTATRETAFVCWTPRVTRLRLVALVFRPGRIIESDAETLCALASTSEQPALLIHARWCDILGREAITRRFFRTLQSVVELLASSLPRSVRREDRRELSIVCISRLLFLSFLEAKGWLDRDFSFLSNGYVRCMAEGGAYHRTILDPLFFGTLNTRVTARSKRARAFGDVPFLNGGLFTRSHLEKRARSARFSDAALGTAYKELLTHYRFTPREDSTAWSEASIDPEILGKAFEALMAAENRKASGAFYTPQTLVADATEEALKAAVASEPDLRTLSALRVLDPACGSGAFVVYALERLAELRIASGENGSVGEIRRRVLTTSIFGVDTNPVAVWLCELRLWLSVTIDAEECDPMKVTPLPNLDRHIRVGDSLLGGGFSDFGDHAAGRGLIALRSRYVRATGPRKRSLARSLDRYERRMALAALSTAQSRLQSERREMLRAVRARDLFGERQRPSRTATAELTTIRAKIHDLRKREYALREGAALPFSFSAHFADIAKQGGFNVVIGNPPWVRIHNIPKHHRERLRREFTVYRHSAWESGAAHSAAGRGFSAQVDLSALFVERSVGLLCESGVLSFLLPAKLWRSLAGGGVRQLLLERTELLVVDDHSAAKQQFDAAVYPSLVVCKKRLQDGGQSRTPTFHATVRTSRIVRWSALRTSLPFDSSDGSPWLLVPPAVRDSFDRVRGAGVPMNESVFGRPLLGVKTGCNRAYIVRIEDVDGDLAQISNGEFTARVEREMIRPLVRGETLQPWRIVGGRESIVCPLTAAGHNLKSLPPLTRRWLQRYHVQLAARSDLHAHEPWWSIFRTESADSSTPRVVWADFGTNPRAIVVEAGDRTVALNTCYVAQSGDLTDAHALATLLNGPLASAWLSLIAEPARGGYHRYLGWTMALLPVPLKWSSVRKELAELSMNYSDNSPSRSDLLSASLRAYGLTPTEVEPLLSWTGPSD